MDPSYNNGFGSFGNGDAQQPASPTPSGGVGMQPQQPAVSSDLQQDVVLTPSSGSRSKKWIIWLILIICLVGGFCAWYFLNESLKTSKREDLEELYSLLGWASYTEQCHAVVNNVANLDYPSESYKEDINDCLENGARIEELMTKAKSFSNSEDYKAVYVPLATEVSNIVVLGDDLKTTTSLYELWHDWLIDTYFMTFYQTSNDIEKIIKPLEESNNNVLVDYALEWKEKRIELVRANIELEIYPDNESAIEAYNVAKDAYDAIVENAPDINVLTGFNKETSEGEALSLALLKYKIYVEGVL